MHGVILVLFVLLGNYIALVPALSRRRAVERAITVAVVSAVVQPGRAVSSTPADRPAHLADAALYQGATWRIRLIEGLLISPMQHCTKVPLLLNNIRRYTVDPSEQQQLTESLDKLERSICEYRLQAARPAPRVYRTRSSAIAI